MAHIVKAYDDDLQKLRRNITIMADKVFHQVEKGLDAFIQNDTALSKIVVDKDKEINSLNENIAESAIEIIALRQPMAYDLRMCVSSFKIANNLERIGDVAKGFTKRIELNDIEIEEKIIVQFKEMLAILVQMNQKVFECFKNKPVELAVEAYKMDEIVDEKYKEIFTYLLKQYPKNHPDDYAALIKIILVLKGMERIGDHITNIAESIYYIFKAQKLKKESNNNS